MNIIDFKRIFIPWTEANGYVGSRKNGVKFIGIKWNLRQSAFEDLALTFKEKNFTLEDLLAPNITRYLVETLIRDGLKKDRKDLYERFTREIPEQWENAVCSIFGSDSQIVKKEVAPIQTIEKLTETKQSVMVEKEKAILMEDSSYVQPPPRRRRIIDREMAKFLGYTEEQLRSNFGEDFIYE